MFTFTVFLCRMRLSCDTPFPPHIKSGSESFWRAPSLYYHMGPYRKYSKIFPAKAAKTFGPVGRPTAASA